MFCYCPTDSFCIREMKTVTSVLFILQVFALLVLPTPPQLRPVLIWSLTHDKVGSSITGLCIVAFVFEAASIHGDHCVSRTSLSGPRAARTKFLAILSVDCSTGNHSHHSSSHYHGQLYNSSRFGCDSQDWPRWLMLTKSPIHTP